MYTDTALPQCGFTLEPKNSNETRSISDCTDLALPSHTTAIMHHRKVPNPKNIAESILVESFQESDTKELCNIVGKDGKDFGFHAILKLAEEEGFDNTLLNRKATSWFKKYTNSIQ